MFFQYQDIKDSYDVSSFSMQISASKYTAVIRNFKTITIAQVRNERNLGVSFSNMTMTSDLEFEFFEAVAFNPNLQRIWISDFNGSTGWCGRFLSALNNKPGLQSLNLNNCNLNIDDARCIAAFLNENRQIRYLDLQYNDWLNISGDIRCDKALIIILRIIRENKIALYELLLLPKPAYSTITHLPQELINYTLATMHEIPSILRISLEEERIGSEISGLPDGYDFYSPEMNKCLQLAEERSKRILTKLYWEENLAHNAKNLIAYCTELRKEFDKALELRFRDDKSYYICPCATKTVVECLIAYIRQNKTNMGTDVIPELLPITYYLSSRLDRETALLSELQQVANEILHNILLTIDTSRQDHEYWYYLFAVAISALRIVGNHTDDLNNISNYLAVFTRIVLKKYAIDEERYADVAVALIETANYDQLIESLQKGLPKKMASSHNRPS